MAFDCPSSYSLFFYYFYHIRAWRPSWSCDLDHLYKLSFPLPKEAPYKIWLKRRCLKIMYMYIAPGQTAPRGQNIFKNISLLLTLSFAASFSLYMTFLHFFLFKCIDLEASKFDNGVKYVKVIPGSSFI